MFDIAKKFFGKFETGDGKREGRATDDDLRVAACALLLEMSLMDGKFSKTERERLLTIIRNEYDLSDEGVESLIRRSREELDESIDLWAFTNAINQHYSVDEKLHLIEKMWEIAYADGSLDQHENYLVHKVADLLHLSHRQLMDAKLKVKDSVQ
jgi:uncharacterized tellurite resistance protein B-like protein